MVIQVCKDSLAGQTTLQVQKYNSNGLQKIQDLRKDYFSEFIHYNSCKTDSKHVLKAFFHDFKVEYTILLLKLKWNKFSMLRVLHLHIRGAPKDIGNSPIVCWILGVK